MKDEMRSHRQANGRNPPRTRKWGRYLRKFRTVTRTRNHQTHVCTPRHVEISVPFGKEPFRAGVMSDGQFSAVVETDKDHYFTRGKNSDLKKGYSWWWHEREILFKAEHPLEAGKFRGDDWKYRARIWTVDASSKVIRALAECISHVQIEIYDRDSRVAVSPEIIISPIDVPGLEDIVSKWRYEYDDYIAQKAKKHYEALLKKQRARLWRGAKTIRPTSAITFWGYRGSRYKVETKHKDYYYFSTVLEILDAPETKRTFLLVKIGSKIRIDD